ncbi:MAG: T9SS type A sorting domain-containing protein [Calditrichaeota bacterium]|nr:T9SS type A sorting domain-containing protein [Calditrichota bacterium]MBT7790002.1 T9SS type A sorting domain-containing protein [Calditrichota bacterium]
MLLLLLGFPLVQGICASGNIEARSNKPSTIWIDPIDINNNSSIEELLLMTGYQSEILSGNLRLIRKTHFATGLVVKYGQYLSGLRVIGGGVTIRCDVNELPVSVYSTLSNLNIEKPSHFSFNAERAIETASESINFNFLRSEIAVDRVILPHNNELKHCWRVKIPSKQPTHDWEIFVDGESGDILLSEDRLLRFDGVGSVFMPDPMTALHDTTLRDEEDDADAIPEEAYVNVEIRDVDQNENNQFNLTGPYVDTSPSETRAYEDELSFIYSRADDRFEEVMAYFHIDHQARYISSLGFEDLPPSPILVDANRLDEDISFYSPFTGILTTGTGGIDDAEDADVLIHEYSHAIVYLLTDGWRGGETAVLSEGICDYFAGEYSLNIDPDFQPYKLYNWDGHNDLWDGRILNSDLTYPEIENLDSHIAGQMWSSLLIEVLESSENRDMFNTIVIDHISALGDSATIYDAAESLLHSDLVINNAVFRRFIVQACESRRITISGEFSPRIVHTELLDSEEINSAHVARVEISSEFPLDPDRLWLIFGFANEIPDTLNLQRENVNEDIYRAEIPAPGIETNVYYYFVATDTAGVFTTLPAGAPLTSFRFRIGADRQPPAILSSDSLENTVFGEHSANFKARVIDNLGIREVSLVLFNLHQQPLDQFTLEPLREEPGCYMSAIHWSFDGRPALLYQVNAIDNSRSRNMSHGAMTSFSLNEEAVFDGFEHESSRWQLSGWGRDNGAALSGIWGLSDRESQDIETPREAIAVIDESWDLSSFGRFKVFFWEKHVLNRDDGEVGFCEISSDDGESWSELLQITGTQFWWIRHELDLDEYTGPNHPPVQIRWRSYIPEGAHPGEGWHIDNIFISTDNIVGIGQNDRPSVGSQILSEPYPNPTNGKFNLSYQLLLPGQIKIFDINGRNIINMPLHSSLGRVSLNMDKYVSGSYFITLENDDTILRKQLILIK